MKSIQALLAAATATLALIGTSAHADTLWNFSFSDIATGVALTGSGSFATTGDGSTPSDITTLSGTYSDGTTTGALTLIPVAVTGGVQNTSADGLYWYDNVYGGSTGFDVDGLLFLAGSQEVNLYYQGGMQIVTQYNGSYVTTPVTFSAIAVPEPGSIAMLLAGIGALGLVSRRKAIR